MICPDPWKSGARNTTGNERNKRKELTVSLNVHLDIYWPAFPLVILVEMLIDRLIDVLL